MFPTINAFKVPAKVDTLAPVRKKLQLLLESAGFDSKATHDVLLSVDEVLTNVIRHAYKCKPGEPEKGQISVSFSEFEDRAEIIIEDEGPCFDPRSIPAPKLPSEKPGGLGIFLVRSLMDELHYEPLKPQGNRLRIVKFKKAKERNSKP